MPEGSHTVLHQGPMGEESPQLSSPLSAGEHEQEGLHMDADCYIRLCAEPLDGEGERPVSLVSTLSSGSSRDSHSLFGSTVALQSSTTPPTPSEEDIDLELSPAEGTRVQAGVQSPALRGFRGRWQDQLEPSVVSSQRNNNNAAASSRKASSGIPHIPVSPVIADTMAPNPKLTYVDRVVMEIIETERMYVRDLRSIVEDYLAHIIDTGNLPIKPEQVCALFGNIEDIYEFNSELLQSLDMCENDPVAIARCFVDKSEYFEIYTQYCNNYPNSVAALTECMRSKTLAKFFRDRQAALKRSLPLGSYLLKPVQRILKYHLLLQEIAKHFDQDEEGYDAVQEAIDSMTGVAWYINDMKRKHEHAVRVQEIQSLLINWKGPDLTTYGELVLEGTFHVQRAKNTRTLFLFEKMLLITKKRGEHYVYKTHISCSTLMLLDSAKDPLLFSVIHFKHPKQPHTVQAKSVEEKRLWAHHIKRLILENHSTIVPQKAKEAIMENSIYPGKYRYSPERLKRTESCKMEDFHLGGRNARRRSEPAKQIIRSTKAVLKDDQKREAAELKPAQIKEVETPCREEEQRDVAVAEAVTTQVSAEEPPPLDCVPQSKTKDQLEEQSSQCPESPVSSSQEADTPEPEDTSSRETGEEEGESDSSGLQMEDTNILTNEELSEEEEEVFSDNKSILPSSVLDQASVIAEHFISSLSRRSSLVSEDLHTPACPSPSVANDILDNPSVCVGFEKKPQMSENSSPEPQVTLEANLSTPHHEPVLNTFNETERRCTLSKQDLLLIHKIRRYYEYAENQDANFSIKRRESLSHIPAGLVRHLSRQLDSIPQEQAIPVLMKGPSPNRPTSWSVFDLPGLERSPNPETDEIDPQRSVEAKARSQSFTETSTSDEEFKSSSDMLKVWEDIEMDVNNSLEENKEVQQIEEEIHEDSSVHVTQGMDVNLDISDVKTSKDPQQILEEPEISAASEGSSASSSTSSPTTPSPTVEGRSDQDSKQCKSPKSQERSRDTRTPLPKIISFRSSMDEDQILQDMGKMKNKVFQLARQYSQRIKNNRPPVWQRSRQSANQQVSKNMPAVREEKLQWRNKGKPDLTLAFNMYDQAIIHELRSPSPVRSPSSGASSQFPNPQSPESETFHWPDVQELRSKYTPLKMDTVTSHTSKLAHSCTVPEEMLKCCTNGLSSWEHNGSHSYNDSSDLHKAQTGCTETQPATVHNRRSSAVEDWLQLQSQPKLQPLLCRWSSLDHMLGSHPLHEVQNLQDPVRTCSTAARMSEMTRENSKPSGVGLLLQEGPDCTTKKTESKLVKNLREKFQNLSS